MSLVEPIIKYDTEGGEELEQRRLESERHNKVFEIIGSLNQQNRQGESQIFDCGVLGFVRMWWHNGWEWSWFEPNTEFKESTAIKQVGERR